MNLYDFTKKYGEGKGESMMWKTVHVISDAIEKDMDPEAKENLMRRLYEAMTEGHYDEHFAKMDVAKMYYTDDAGQKKYAPYWSDEQVKAVYDSVHTLIPDEYNFWDFYVTLQMIKSDYCPLLRKWFPNATPEEMDKKLVELAINWLNDSDNPFGDEKIWKYLNEE